MYTKSNCYEQSVTSVSRLYYECNSANNYITNNGGSGRSLQNKFWQHCCSLVKILCSIKAEVKACVINEKATWMAGGRRTVVRNNCNNCIGNTLIIPYCV